MTAIQQVHILPDINLDRSFDQDLARDFAPSPPIRARRPWWRHEAMTVAWLRDTAAATRRGAAEIAATIADLPFDYDDYIVFDDELRQDEWQPDRSTIEMILREDHNAAWLDQNYP